MSKPNWSEITPEMMAEGDLLYKYLSQVMDEATLQAIMRELLSESELMMLSQRWVIARLLSQGMSVRDVAEKAGVSTTTVVRVSQILRRKGSSLSLFLATINDSPEARDTENKSNKYAFGQEE